MGKTCGHKGYALCLAFDVSVLQVVLWDQDLAPIAPADPVGRIVLAHLAELVPVSKFAVIRCAVYITEKSIRREVDA